MITMIIGLVGALIGLIGWFGFHSVFALIIGTALYFIETIIEWKNLNVNAKTLDMIIFVVGCVVSIFISLPWYIGGMVAINIYSAIVTILGIFPILVFFFKR